jgi:hypothetical protein
MMTGIRSKQLILKELLEIIEIWPEKDVANHICTIMRPYKDAYHWTDDMLLKKIEKYRNELETELDDE